MESFEEYITNGCMRCKYGGTPQCKVLKWVETLIALREIVLETGLKEEIKWGVPVYTSLGKNIVTINALKNSANIGFFKGALLRDKYQLLKQQGNMQSDRIIKFNHAADIQKAAGKLHEYIIEAIEIEKSGLKVAFNSKQEALPAELMYAFESDHLFKEAFSALTPGRQRGYIIYFSEPKTAQTRVERIKKHRENICNGIGLHDKYKSKDKDRNKGPGSPDNP